MKKYFLVLLSLFFCAVFLFGLTPVNAQYGLDITAGKAGYNKSETPYTITTTIVNAALAIVYIAFFILVLYAGLRWMTAQGNEEHVTKAKNILEAAIIGVAVVSAAYAITNFVLGKVGADKIGNNVPAVADKCSEVTCPSGKACDVNTGECCDMSTGVCEAPPAPPTTPAAPLGSCTDPGGCVPDITQSDCSIISGVWVESGVCPAPPAPSPVVIRTYGFELNHDGVVSHICCAKNDYLKCLKQLTADMEMSLGCLDDPTPCNNIISGCVQSNDCVSGTCSP